MTPVAAITQNQIEVEIEKIQIAIKPKIKRVNYSGVEMMQAFVNI